MKSFYVASGNLDKEKFLVSTEFFGRDREGCRKWKKLRKVGRNLKFWVATKNWAGRGKSWVATRNFRSQPSSVMVGRLVCRDIKFACCDIG